MKKIVLTLLAFLLLTCQSAFAANPYPRTLDNGNLVFVAGHMGYGIYAIRSSVDVQLYQPPKYQIAINSITVNVDTGQRGDVEIHYFRYNWDTKTVYYYSQQKDTWLKWDLNCTYSFATGAPFVPNLAEVAFVSAYNMKFYGNKLGYTYGSWQRVIPESLYQALGI
ncbi:hypothetical protein SAMN04487861_10811 [Selenomonas ruminantium]|uniref:Uncharacterized protein n=1 Tax=Selenomonas ruminantium TaxID=971 RepID=A0A1I3DVC6_SELRU|nr:hypothetical protein [Selenomonas ruminantium]SFH90593.1 hypothetical protein SAMN04487861_10811 [Selenomonas ruminantium]